MALNELPSTRHKAGCNIPPCGVDAQVFTMEHVELSSPVEGRNHQNCQSKEKLHSLNVVKHVDRKSNFYQFLF